MAQFNRYRSDFVGTKFPILYTDSHQIPRGSILVGPTVERKQHEEIRKALINISPAIAASVGYIANAPVPDYQELVKTVF
ncbi:MAG: hypothetical protein F6K10_08780 [Moorea sp. SIO2B7]|nr:hypothetical protein [Moorena sp. SIO2B7]